MHEGDSLQCDFLHVPLKYWKPFFIVSHHNKTWKSQGVEYFLKTPCIMCVGVHVLEESCCHTGQLLRCSSCQWCEWIWTWTCSFLFICFCISMYCMLRFSSFSSLIHFLSLHSNLLYRLSRLSPSVIFIGPPWPFLSLCPVLFAFLRVELQLCGVALGFSVVRALLPSI